MRTKRKIIAFYLANDIFVSKVIRTRLNDGWFVYHNAAMEHNGYAKPTIIHKTGSKTIYKINRIKIASDFIADDMFEDMIDMQVGEARIRSGLPCKKKIYWNEFKESEA